MDFYAELDEVLALVHQRGRVTYRALTECFALDDDRLDAIRSELSYSHSDCVIDDGQGLVWRPPEPEHRDAERRQLTVLFCDLVDSTPLSTRLDPEDLREVMRSYYRACGDVIACFDGYIAQYLGDGLVVFFGYPHAHEDAAQRAVRAGLGIIEAVAAVNADLTERHAVQLGVRLGCHTGLVVVGEVVGDQRHELMALGDTPNIAARLQGAAPRNALVIGPLTHQLVDGFFACRSLGAPPLKGVTASLEIFEVLHESDARSRLEAAGTMALTPLVGRAGELATLERCWADAMDGHGAAVLITGEPGIGKSRLVHALTEHAAREGAWLTWCQGSPYHRDTAFYPFIDLFERRVLGARRPESPVDRLRKLEEFFEDSGLPLDDLLPHLCSVLSIPPGPGHTFPVLPPEQQKRRTLDALQSIVVRRSVLQPVLLVVEDLHWIDPSTLELIGLLIERISDVRVLAVFTARPEFRSPWQDHADVVHVDLSRMTSDEAGELVRCVARDTVMPKEIVVDVVAKTDGVPLFIEELTKTLLESGGLAERASESASVGSMLSLDIPTTLHDSLLERLDRLGRTKGLAQLCAALGREFSYLLLRAVSPWAEEDVDNGLVQLVSAEFLQQRGAPPDATYRFKHALIQDAAYQSVLKTTRQQHHQRIAQTLRTRFDDIVDTQPELLAHHYTAAGMSEQALPYWYAAARRALSRHANREAANHAARGLELLGTLPDTRHRAELELRLQAVLGPALSYVNGPHSVDANYARLYELGRRLNDDVAMSAALAGLSYARIVQGRLGEARSLAEEHVQIATQRRDALDLAEGHCMLAYAAWWQGDVTVTREHSRHSIAFYAPDRHLAVVASFNQNPRITSGYLYALSNWVLGHPSLAVEAMESTLAYARELNNPTAVGTSILFSAQLHQLRREPALARSQADEALAISSEQGLHALSLWCLLPRGWARAQQGDVVGGIADIREAMDRRRAFGMRAVWPWYYALLAEAMAAHGDCAAALTALTEGEQWVQRNDERLYAAELRRIRGEVLLRRSPPDPAGAERSFEQALEIARDQQARSWELRAAISLARMWLQHNRIDESRSLLEPVLAGFTEGFDTADLRDARDLLGRLS